jgi:hypothetical protein
LIWCDERVIPVGHGEHVNAFWHCFGVKDEIVDARTALRMLDASHTALLPINCHRLNEAQPVYASGKKYGEPLIGHGTVTWDEFKHHAVNRDLVPCLNINLQTSMDAAVKLARDGYKRTGINLLKLEVLTDDLLESDDAAVIKATKLLDDYRVMPLISANVEAAEELVDLGVPLLRVMGSPIGSARGIDNPHAVREIVSLGVPVILDGGIGYVGHALEALRLGCAGLLVNSALFTGGDPASRLAQFRQAIKNWSPEMMAHWRGEPELEWVEWYSARRNS